MDIIAQAAAGSSNKVAIQPLLLALPLLAVVVLLLRWGMQRKARRMGYPKLSSYLWAIPRNDTEKADAVEMLARGVIICVLGVLFPPLVIFGIVPLYYGCRKIGCTLIGVRHFSTDDVRADQSGPSN